MRKLNEFVLSGECEPVSATLGDATSVLIEGVCAKLKPDWVTFSHIGIAVFTCSQAEQEKDNDESLPFTLAFQSFFGNKRELSVFLKRRASIILKIAEDMCSGPERMTLTEYGLAFFFIKASAGIGCTVERHGHVVYFWRELVDLSDSAVASAELSSNDQEVTLVGQLLIIQKRCQGSTPE